MTNPLDALLPVWNPFLVWPIEHALLALTGLTTSAGIAIIIFTVAVRTLMLPLSIIQIRSQKAMMALQPQLRELQRRHAGDRARIGQEQMRLYKEAGVNPAAGCLPLVLQMPIWFALYSALLSLGNADNGAVEFQAPFLWIPNLGHGDPFYILPVLTGVTQWVVQKMSVLPSADPQQQQMNRMMEFMPIMFFVFSLQVASGLTLYWVISNVYSFFQQYFTVGWGSLPILGARAAVAPANGGTDGQPTRSPRPRQRRSGASSRRKRGK